MDIFRVEEMDEMTLLLMYFSVGFGVIATTLILKERFTHWYDLPLTAALWPVTFLLHGFLSIKGKR